jgi:hypothetical protein
LEQNLRGSNCAHRDLDVALMRNAKPLTPASREKVKNALDRLADVLNAVSHKYFDSESVFSGSWYPGGAEALLHVLDSGADIQTKRRDRIKRGEPSPKTLNTRSCSDCAPTLVAAEARQARAPEHSVRASQAASGVSVCSVRTTSSLGSPSAHYSGAWLPSDNCRKMTVGCSRRVALSRMHTLCT